MTRLNRILAGVVMILLLVGSCAIEAKLHTPARQEIAR